MKKRNYSREDVRKLQGSMDIEHTLARRMANKMRMLLAENPYIHTFGAYNGQQAVQHVKAGLKAIYCSGWQVAAAANSNNEVYPDQSLYSVDSVPNVVRNINNAFRRADQIQYAESGTGFEFAPIIADAEAGFGGVLNSYELARNLIEAGAAGVHFEDQLASAKKCGHLGGKVLIPLSDAIRNLNAARLAADVAGVDTLVVARTDAESARLLSSDYDQADYKWMSGDRTADGFWQIEGGLEMGCERGAAYAEYADLVWCETSKPCLKEARRFADAVKGSCPDAMLAYNCSPSFNWRKNLDEETIAKFQVELGNMGYKFQFVTLAGFHALNTSMFELAKGYKESGMAAYSQLQEREFELERTQGFRAVKHQRFVGTGYFDSVQNAINGGQSSTAALKGSTEEEQFEG